MNLKKLKIISIFGIFLICFLSHYLYTWFPNDITAIFFPVNESIWEHMKMAFTSIMIWKLFEYIIIKYCNLLYHNFLFSNLISSILFIIVYLLIYLPLFILFGENIIISITLLFIVICFEEYINYKVMILNSIKYTNLVSLFSIIVIYIFFGYLTYNPPRNFLFFDFKEGKFGESIYIIDNKKRID